MSYVNKNGSRQLEDGRWEHCFSQSFISGFQTCPEQARASYFRETPDDEYTDSTALGTAVHAGIEYGLAEKLTRGVPSIDELIDVGHNELDTIGEWKYTKLSRKNVFTKCAVMLSAWLDDIEPQVDPGEIERAFKVPLYSGKHRDINLVGTIDCIDQDYVPWDWKTASRPHEVWEHQRWAVQPTVYTYAVKALHDQFHHEYPELPLSRFRYGVMLYDGTVQVYDVDRDESHVSWLKEVCSQIAWMIEHGVNPWPLNDGGWWCSDKWCPKWGDCKGAHMLDGWEKAPVQIAA